MRERTASVSWLEAALLAFPPRGNPSLRGSGLTRRILPPPERAGPVQRTGPLTVAGPRRIHTGFRKTPFAMNARKLTGGADGGNPAGPGIASVRDVTARAGPGRGESTPDRGGIR
jgi:hypothetical protein